MCIIEDNKERVEIIEKLLTFKISLENSKEDLLDELICYYSSDTEFDIRDRLKEFQCIKYRDQCEAYLITQIVTIEKLPPMIDEHIRMLNIGEDIDMVLESLELEIYTIKKDIYRNLDEWKSLLDHITKERANDIVCNPKGHGDLLLKELFWIRKCEEKYRGS